MATKASQQTLINGFTDSGNNTAAEFRTQQTGRLDNGYIYGSDTGSSQTYTTKNGSITFTYRLHFTKSNGIISGDIEVQNTGTSNIANGATAFTWKVTALSVANEFRCGGGGDIYRCNAEHDLHALSDIFIRFTEDGMYFPQGLPAGAKYYAQIQYPSYS